MTVQPTWQLGRRRRVLLGVTGSIAAYKSAELVRLWTKAGLDVRVIMTRSATEFLSPVTLATLSGHPVTVELFGPPAGMYAAYGDVADASGTGGTGPGSTSVPATGSGSAPAPASGSGLGSTSGSVTGSAPGSTSGFVTGPAPGSGSAPASASGGRGVPASRGPEASSLPAGGGPAGSGGGSSSIDHIRSTRESNLIVVAPATANVLGKIVGGVADDALTTTVLASSAPTLFAPAMNTRMWEHPAVQENVARLRKWGYAFVDPGSGDLACGEVGAGRMADPLEIVGAGFRILNAQEPPGPRLLVTAGGTEEPLDPVRTLSNRSSGRMGVAIAEAGRDLGFQVTLVRGRTEVVPPAGVDVVSVGSAEEMGRAVRSLHKTHPLLVMAAAVADYRPKTAARQKIRSDRERLSLDLVQTEDILASLAGKRRGMVTVGFALETGATATARKRAREKLEAKDLDLIVLNNPLRKGAEFGSERNEVTFLDRAGVIEALPLLEKSEVARRLLIRAAGLHAGATGV